jgi:oligoendopeptidase F
MSLGHGVHQVLAGGKANCLWLDAPDAGRNRERIRRNADLPQDRCSAKARTQAERKTLLAGKVEDMINTVVRQIAFY